MQGQQLSSRGVLVADEEQPELLRPPSKDASGHFYSHFHPDVQEDGQNLERLY
jgi:hypothetical protein